MHQEAQQVSTTAGRELVPCRIALPLVDQATRGRERWENTPDESWFSKWTPLPPGVHRGPYVRPTRDVLTVVQAGLQRLLER